jgi:hypothetical protein
MFFGALLLAISVCSSAAAPLDSPLVSKCTFADAEKVRKCDTGCLVSIGPIINVCRIGTCAIEYIDLGEGAEASPVLKST